MAKQNRAEVGGDGVKPYPAEAGAGRGEAENEHHLSEHPDRGYRIKKIEAGETDREMPWTVVYVHRERFHITIASS